jgi:hypothetical protein
VNSNDTQLVVLHGIAGSGKSGVVHEVTERLRQAAIPYLPLRLDRQPPGASARQFGQQLDLPESPAFCLQQLAGQRPAVLLLDQVDALRWTSMHSAEAWEVCQELIREALALHTLRVVVCCRTFDLEHDPRIRSWAAEQQTAERIPVGDLPAPDVAQVVARLGLSYQDLHLIEQSLLTNFFHLSLWADVLLKTGATPRFSTSRELLRSFWASRYDALADLGITHDRVDRILGCLVDSMERREALVAPIRVLGASQREQEAFGSLHILQVDDGQVGFCHQSHLDYLVARRVMAEIDHGTATVLSWLGDRTRQTLFRRERLRLVLGLLRDERPADCLAAVRELLAPPSIRFHMKQLVLESLGQVPDPRPAELDLVVELLDDQAWRPHILGEVVASSPPWFTALDDRGMPAAWLAGQDDNRRDAMLAILRRMARTCGDRVGRLLGPFEQLDTEWEQRCVPIARSGVTGDSPALFALVLRLARRGQLLGDHIPWVALARESFIRFVELVEATIAAQHEKYQSRGRSFALWDAHWPAIAELPLADVDEEVLRAGFRSLAQTLNLVRAGALGDPCSFQDALTLNTTGLRSVPLGTLSQVLKSIATELIGRSPSSVTPLLHGQSLPLPAQLALLDALAEAPQLPGVADLALDWLMAEPARLRLRFNCDGNPWHLSGRLLARLSAYCSDTCLASLETLLLNFKEPDLLERYRDRHDLLFAPFQSQLPSGPHRGLGCLARPSCSGATPYHLLSQLDPTRTSHRARGAMQELRRKFARVSPVFFTGWPPSQALDVRSPISRLDVLKRLSDRSWLRLITSQTLRQPRRPYGSIIDGAMVQSSPASFASNINEMAALQPERFARLALRIPPRADRRFIAAILRALARGRPQPASTGQEQQDAWKPASPAALEALLALPQVRDDQSAMDFCSVVEAHADYPWTDDVLLHMVAIATHHPDPRPGQFGVLTERSDDAEDDHLSDNALNSTRGAAGFAIRKLLFRQPARFSLLRPALEALVSDPHPAIRISAVAACLPVQSVDSDQAISWFLSACELDEHVLPTNEANDFLRYSFLPNLSRFKPVIERMIGSRRSPVARRAAFWVGAGHLMSEGREAYLPPLFARSLTGTSAQRQGIAEIAGLLMRDPAHHAAAKPIFRQLADDPDPQVQQRLMAQFSQLDFDLFSPGDPFLALFAATLAFRSNPSPLLWKLQNHAGPLLDFAPCILQVARTFVNDLAPDVQDPRRGLAPDVHILVPLLLRLYADSSSASSHQAVHQECLNLWDLLLERRVTASADLTQELAKL